jgi:outer membrane protein assembly factor BamB
VEKSHAGAARLYRRILSLDPSRHDIQEILDCVDEDRRKALRRLRRRRAGMRVIAYCVLFVGFYVYYERQAAYALDTIDVSYLVKEGDYDEAARHYESFIKRYPLSLSSMRANTAIAGLDVTRQERVREKQAEERRHEEKIAAEQRKVEKTYRDAHQALHRDDLEAALDLFKQARDAAPRREWVTRENLADKIENLERYLREAEAIWRKARELEGHGQVEQAHAQFRALQKEFGRAAVARDLKFPIRLVSHPPGASVLSEDGKPLGRTPLVVRAIAGRSVWRFEHDGYEALATAVAPEADGLVEVALSRSPAWEFETPAVLVSEPALSAGVLYAGGRDGKLHALQLSQRRLLWSYEFQGLTDATSTPVLWRGLLFVAAGDGQVHCLDPLDHGRALWRRPVEGLARGGAPVPAGDHVLVPGTNGRVIALATATGEPRWSRDVEAAAGVAAVSDGDRFFVGTRGGHVLALRSPDGEEAGRFQAGPGAVTGLMLAAPDRLAVVTETGRVALLQLPQCVPVWETKVPAGVPVPPVVSHGRLVVAGRDGSMIAFDLESGREMARSGPDGAPSGAPRVVGGAIYLVTVPGALRVREGKTLELLWGRELPGAPEARVIGGPEYVLLLGTGRKLLGYPQE